MDQVNYIERKERIVGDLMDKGKVLVEAEKTSIGDTKRIVYQQRIPWKEESNTSSFYETIRLGAKDDKIESNVISIEDKDKMENYIEDRDENEEKVTQEICNYHWKKRLLYNQGFGVVEVILLIVIIVALIILFRDKIQEIFEKAMSALTQSTDSILNKVTPAP